jgi:hypothetical protein
MRGETRVAIAAIVAHAAVNVAHGAAHRHLGVPLTPAQALFVGVVILAAPILAGILLWRDVRRTGGALLLSSMFGALVFGVWNHFVVPGADNALSMPAGPWGTLFQVTSALLALTEAWGCWAGLRCLRG